MKKVISLFAAVAAISANLLFAPAAFAHDEVTATYPAAGETVEAGQFSVSVTFNEQVMENPDNSGFEILVSDAQGAPATTGCLMAGGDTVSVITSIAKPGDYTVAWRSVSNDGHPSEGTFKFKVENTTGYEQEAADALACPMLMAEPVAIDDSMKRDATSKDSSDNGLVGLGIGAAFIVLGGVATAVTVKIRERRASKSREKKNSNDDDPNGDFITIIS